MVGDCALGGRLSKKETWQAHPWVVEVVKGQDINVKGQALQEEHGSQHARPLDLWQGFSRHVPLKVLACVQPVASAITRAPRSPSPLRCLHPAKYKARSEAVWRQNW